MSNNYYFYPGSSSNNYAPPNTNHSWSEWSIEQQQYNASTYPRNNSYNKANSISSTTNHGSVSNHSSYRSPNFYNRNVRGNFQQRRFNNTNSQPNAANLNVPWQQRKPAKRVQFNLSTDDLDVRQRATKKRKKPLSQNVPKRDWTVEEAKAALAVEKEYNKRYKNQSLIIKFPDLELNKDIVAKFHHQIENVHFQQPSTPRFCFVTLKEDADADKVITKLNYTRFGNGFLSAEYKKDREENQNIGPEDIDPLTLFVGNLAQEITKEDMLKAYPKNRRIDIGYAKKMKFTRYAFVSFKTVQDSIEALRNTHSTQMYSKSLIVRFRRMHGTVGMPGEIKLQSPVKNKPETAYSNGENPTLDLNQSEIALEDDLGPIGVDIDSRSIELDDSKLMELNDHPRSLKLDGDSRSMGLEGNSRSIELDDNSIGGNIASPTIDLSLVKNEPVSSSADEEEIEPKKTDNSKEKLHRPIIKIEPSSSADEEEIEPKKAVKSRTDNSKQKLHQPIIEKIKTKIKSESVTSDMSYDDENMDFSDFVRKVVVPIRSTPLIPPSKIKTCPNDDEEDSFAEMEFDDIVNQVGSTFKPQKKI